MNPPTLKDVAREANLSVTQVSRALNGHDDVSSATRELAHRIASELGYVPNLHARRLRDPAHRIGAIGIILDSDSLRFSDPFFGDLLTSMVAAAAQHGLQLHLSTPRPGTDPVTHYEDAVRHRRVDGFILLRTLVDDPRVDFLAGREVPFVTFGRPTNDTGHSVVDVVPDALEPAVTHLVELGHRRIACLVEPLRYAISARRMASFSDAIATADLDDSSVVVAGFHEDDGFAAVTELLTGPAPPSAIVAVNDLLALGALRAAATLGVAVPDRLSVVGFDDIAAAGLVRPGLTTLHHSAVDVGVMLVDELLELADSSSNSGRERLVTPRLMVRESTGPAPR